MVKFLSDQLDEGRV